MLGGVCGGLGNFFTIDPVLIRLMWVVSFFAVGVGFLAYIIAWIIVPEEPGV
jgi:phage shock protein C